MEIPGQISAEIKSFGKARFAQLAAENIPENAAMPDYVRKAVEWLQA
jgi:putative ATP-dependent endonuclease of the OLD family